MDPNVTTEDPPTTGEQLKAGSPKPQPLAIDPPPFPDPKTSPADFLTYLRSLAIEDLVAAFQHLQAPPVRVISTNLFDEDVISAWTDRMDVLVVSSSLNIITKNY
jgi:hypothetical protein